MIHQIKFAFRSLKRSFFTTSLNFIGLSTAFTAFILIMFYVWNEYHFDCYNEHVNEIYRLEVKSSDNSKTSVYMLGPTGQTLVDEFPEIEASTIFMSWGKWSEETFTWYKGDEQIKSFEDYAYSDKYLTDVFTLNILEGTKEQPLAQPESAIVSEEFALKAWGISNPVGKHLTTNGNTYTVTAVFEELPQNSVINSPIILTLPLNSRLAEAAKGWNMTNYPQFIKVAKGTDTKKLNNLINDQSIIKSKYRFYRNGTVSAEIVARPLRDLRFNSETDETPIFTSINRVFVNSLFWVGIMVLLVALINFINFVTATVPQNIKSISITRIIGNTRLNTILISIFETVFVFAVSIIVAIALATIINSHFTKSVIGYSLPFAENIPILIGIATGGIILGILVGWYTALYRTSGKPVETIKQLRAIPKFNFRSVLTVSQFTATIALIMASALVIKQVRFMKEADLGFQKSNTLVLRINDELRRNYTAFENKLKTLAQVQGVARSTAVPGHAQEIQSFNVNGEDCPVWYWAVDGNYIELMGFEIITGRNFIGDSQSEQLNMICNETAARQYKWEIGTQIGNGILVGIMKDFNFVSLREKVQPFSFWYSNSDTPFNSITIKLNSDNIKETLAAIEKYYTEFSPDIPFHFYFLDDELNILYAKEGQQVKLITFFSLLSIIVSTLGILGLSTFMCQYRIKEIGIRKVNGAKVSEILAMLNKDFVKWVVIAFAVAAPIAYYAMNKWLENFAYKTTLSWWIFSLAGLLVMAVVLLTVCMQSWKTATRNPVEALRYE